MNDTRDANGLVALITIEAALVTVIGVARERAEAGDLDLAVDEIDVLRAAQCQDEAHYHLLRALGAVPATEVFAIAESTLGGREPLLRFVLALKEIATGAGMALARAQAGAGEPPLAETIFAMGAIEAGHATLLRRMLGQSPPNDRAFLPWRFTEAADALVVLAETGLLDVTPDAVAFPGPLPRDCRGVAGLVPQTTEDALRWRDITAGPKS
ncbi:MAG: hypothetical protein IT337_03485 [Thermomicrobiales bacterium]|nr:hypothetical protein [Thermomicrobiales bacterium]